MKFFAGNNHPQIEIYLSDKNSGIQALLDKKLTEQSTADEVMAFINQWGLSKTGSSYGKYGAGSSLYTWGVYG